jgi:MFS family permease
MSLHPQAAAGAPWPSRAAGWYATILLTLSYTFSFVDRQVLNLLVEPIKSDLHLSDTQISLLQGLAFVVPYVLFSVPIGRWVDAYNRVRILIGGVLFWSVACIACGFARTPLGLTFARMGVGVGEAAVTPVAWSVLADYFPPHARALPVSVFLMGPYLGAGLALLAGAEVIEWARTIDEISLPVLGVIAPWQFTFIVVGLPGFILAALLATMREPPRQERLQVESQASLSWKETLAFIWQRRRIYGAFLLGVPFLVVVLYALQAWVPTWLVRVHGLDLASAGRTYGTIALVAGSLGVLSGPPVALWLARRGCRDEPLRVAVIALLLLVPCVVGMAWTSETRTALFLLAIASYLITLPMALFTAAIQLVTPNEMRGLVAGMFVVAVSVIGLTFGPTSVALLTDKLFADPLAVGRSMAIVTMVCGPVAMVLFATGMPEYRRVSEALR